MYCLSLVAFQIFSLSLVLFTLSMVCLVVWLLESENLCLSTYLVKCCSLFLQITFCLVFILFWWVSSCTYIYSCIIFSQITEIFFTFENIFVFQIYHNLSIPAQLTFGVRSLFFACGRHFLCIVCLAASLAKHLYY